MFPGDPDAVRDNAEVQFAFWTVQVLGRQPEPGDELRLPDTFAILNNEIRGASKETIELARELVGEDAMSLSVNRERRRRMIEEDRARRGLPPTQAALSAPGQGASSSGRVRRKVLDWTAKQQLAGVELDRLLTDFAQAYTPGSRDAKLTVQGLKSWQVLRPRLPELMKAYASLEEFRGDVHRRLDALGKAGFWGAETQVLSDFMVDQFFADVVRTPVQSRVQKMAERAEKAMKFLDDPEVTHLLARSVGFGTDEERVVLQAFGLGGDATLSRLADARRQGRSLEDELRTVRSEHHAAWKSLSLEFSALNAEPFKTFPQLTRQVLREAGLAGVDTGRAKIVGLAPFASAADEAAREGLLAHDRHYERWVLLAESVAMNGATFGFSFLLSFAAGAAMDLPGVLMGVEESDRSTLLHKVGLADEDQLKQSRRLVFLTFVLTNAVGGTLERSAAEGLHALAHDRAVSEFLGMELLTRIPKEGVARFLTRFAPALRGSSKEPDTADVARRWNENRALIEAVLATRHIDLSEFALNKYSQFFAHQAERERAITAFCGTYGFDLFTMSRNEIEAAFREDAMAVYRLRGQVARASSLAAGA